MSLDDRLRDGLASIVADVDDPHASLERVLASSQRRRRRRRTFAVAGGLVLALGGATLALSGGDDDDAVTQVAGVVVTATTAAPDAAPTTAAPATTAVPAAAPVTTVVPATGAAPAPTTTVPVVVGTGTSTTRPPDGAGTCSSTGMAAATVPAGTLPAAVADMRARVRTAALACDFDALAALAATNPTFSADTRTAGISLAEQWRRADSFEGRFMRGIVGMLDVAPARRDTGLSAAGPTYVWPPFAATEPAALLTDADFAVLETIFGAGHREVFRSAGRISVLGATAGTYLGETFVEIGADGTLFALRRR